MSRLQAKLIWFTGLSGAGKSTLSQLLFDHLQLLGIKSVILDGDVLRETISKDLGFSQTDRSENIRRAGELAKSYIDKNFFTVAAFTSPLRKDREAVKMLVGVENFIEIYCKCSVEICAVRDVKGLYAKAKHGNLKNIVGIDIHYEPPENATLVIDTEVLSVEDARENILMGLEKYLR